MPSHILRDRGVWEGKVVQAGRDFWETRGETQKENLVQQGDWKEKKWDFLIIVLWMIYVDLPNSLRKPKYESFS